MAQTSERLPSSWHRPKKIREATCLENRQTHSGWWLTQPLYKMMEFVSWDDDYSQYIEKKNMFQTTNQHLNHVWQAMKQGFMVPYY